MSAILLFVLSLGVAQPVSALYDVEFNVLQHVVAVRGLGARVVVFPELSLTGYDMGVEAIDTDDPRLVPLVDACGAAGAIALVGCPTRAPDGGKFLSMLQIDGEGVSVAYNKMFLGGAEPQHFTAGSEPAILDVDGWRLGLAICKDTGVSEHAANTAALGIDVYVAGVCETEDDREVQPQRALDIIRQHGVWVAYASFAGPTGGGFDQTAGRSAVWRPDGEATLQLGHQPGEWAHTTLTQT
ncbi:MAG: carbon-nitrogen hydrolase family protein [Acidimicrobiales bacterium]|nr:MAG: carbon-nitrogen hydrolase family protein [Acidimicrobiales bacterium]